MTNGLCGEHTATKQDVFDKFVDHHLKICQQIYQKNGQTADYLYYDVFAGPGYIYNCKYYEGSGSPRRFYQLASSTNIHYKMVLAENNPERKLNLSDVLSNEGAKFELKDDALDCFPLIPLEYNYGLVYIDPPMTVDSFLLSEKIMTKFGQLCPKVDILFYISASWIKRFIGMSHVSYSKRLVELIGEANKIAWIIKALPTSQQYAFLVGTNWKDWAEWSNFGFYNINSSEGYKILTRLNYTEPEQLFQTYGMIQKGLWE